MAAQTAMMRPGPSRDYYLKKRAEGLIHVQALLALARRRVDVLWAMLRDKRPYTSAPPAPPIGLTASLRLTPRVHAAGQVRQDG
jgi:hypothetical protein